MPEQTNKQLNVNELIGKAYEMNAIVTGKDGKNIELSENEGR